MDDLMFQIFKLSSVGFCCTQIMMKLALDEEETENSDLIRVVNGLCNGIGGKQKTCGVLSGGIGILGLYAGKGTERDYANENFPHMMHDFYEWFESEFGKTECEQLIGLTKFEAGNQSYQVKCGDILVKSYDKIREILSEYGYEFGSRESI
ncbi:MAG: DVU_1555 family C-GCAxxG-C-C protein [Velocimicrobium sp.]